VEIKLDENKKTAKAGPQLIKIRAKCDHFWKIFSILNQFLNDIFSPTRPVLISPLLNNN
jgi:hypothetical protein